jgi:hypothetical protein
MGKIDAMSRLFWVFIGVCLRIAIVVILFIQFAPPIMHWVH